MHIPAGAVLVPLAAPRSPQQRRRREPPLPLDATPRLRAVPVETLRVGERVLCHEHVDGRTWSCLRAVKRVEVVEGMVRYDVDGSGAGTRVRCVGSLVMVSGRKERWA